MMIALGLVAVSAQANAGTLLKYTSTNGSVAPAFQRYYTCTVSTTDVTFGSTGPAIRPVIGHKPIKFTKEVPSIVIAQSLIEDAKAYPLTPGFIGPIGGGVETYSAQAVKGKAFTIKLTSGRVTTSANLSISAQKLEAFLDNNCK